MAQMILLWVIILIETYADNEIVCAGSNNVVDQVIVEDCHQKDFKNDQRQFIAKEQDRAVRIQFVCKQHTVIEFNVRPAHINYADRKIQKEKLRVSERLVDCFDAQTVHLMNEESLTVISLKPEHCHINNYGVFVFGC